jgi:aryl-alcohol dehydrogenase-like predicted oxidoreductase
MILGTAQLGLNYGISNKYGRPNFEQVREILDTAYNNGIDILDTAYAYGDSEKMIGMFAQQKFSIISKLPDLSNIHCDEEYDLIGKFINETLSRTGQHQLYAYLLHSINNLSNNGKALWSKMLEFKEKGLFAKVGYSLYSPNQLDLYFDMYRPDIVQIPMNILDREFQKTGWLKKLKENNVEIHVRSVFLQGLLLAGHNYQILKFPSYEHIWTSFRDELHRSQLSALEYCFGFINGIQEVDHVVVGVNSVNELLEVLKSFTVFKSCPQSLSCSDEKLIYPFNWK